MLLPTLVTASAVEKTVWGSPAGKKHLAARLVKLIPAHKVYVEPFAGSGAVFFEKAPVDVEVLGDADPEIADAFKALKTLTDPELEALRKKDWIGRKSRYNELLEEGPKTKVEKLYRFLYLSHFSYGKMRGKSFNPNADGIEATTIARIEKHRERLRRAKFRHAHYAELVKEFDGKDTFFFLDPPYPGHNVEVGEDTFDEVEFRKVLDGIKGRFLVTYGTRGELDTKGFHVRKIRPPRTIRTMRGVGGPKTLPQLLIANYAIAEKSLGADADADAWVLEEVEGIIDVNESLGADVDRARILARALADAPEASTEVQALSRELDRLEPSGDADRSSVARELTELATNLVPALANAAPTIVEAFVRAEEPLHVLAKARTSQAPRASEDEVPALEEAPQQVSSCLSAPLRKRIPLLKTTEARYVFGIVLEPEKVDAQQDIYSAAEVRDAAHRFMEEYRNLGLMHRKILGEQVKILESYLAPAEFEVDGTLIKKGTWLLAVRVVDEELWTQIKAGDLTGFSIGGSAVRSTT